MANIINLTIAGINIEGKENDKWELKSKNWICHIFKVIGPNNVTRDDLDKLKGELLFGKTIRGIESYAIENQYGKTISLAVDV